MPYRVHASEVGLHVLGGVETTLVLLTKEQGDAKVSVSQPPQRVPTSSTDLEKNARISGQCRIGEHYLLLVIIAE
jgi:hypothetical protein